MRDKIAKRYQCQWLLRKSVPSQSVGHSIAVEGGISVSEHSTAVEGGISVSETSCHNSEQRDISNKTKKRCKRSYEDIEREVAAVEEAKFSLERNAIFASAEKDKINLNRRIEIEQAKLKVKETELNNLLSNYNLRKSLETVILSRYKNKDPTKNEKISYKKAAKDVLEVMMQDDFLDGHCASVINKKSEVK